MHIKNLIKYLLQSFCESLCKTCEPGKFTNATGQTSCINCKRGNYCPGNRMNSIPCGTGTYNGL